MTPFMQGITSLNWKGFGIDEFIAAAMGLVKDASSTLQLLKSNIGEIEKILASWMTVLPSSSRRDSKVMGVVEYAQRYKVNRFW